MITAKFGGTAVTAQNLHCIKSIITSHHKCVVVSAVGREHAADVKTTDLLQRHFYGDAHAWPEVCRKYRRLAEVNGVQLDVDKLLFDAERRSRAYDLAYCMSLGEELSARIVAKFLNAQYLEAQELLVFRGKRLARSATFANISSAFTGLSCGVVGGFYGGLTQDLYRITKPRYAQTGGVCRTVVDKVCGTSPYSKDFPRQVFSRGGGDVTGAVCAAATNSTLYENWTDVYGVCLADPKRVGGVSTAQNLSYAEMRLLAQCGAEVLHPQAVGYVAKRAIPIKIGNYLNPQGASTLVSNCPSGLPLLLATESLANGVYSTTVLHGLSAQKAVRILANSFGSLSPCSACDSHFSVGGVCDSPSLLIHSCRVTQNRVDILSSRSVLKEIYAAFSALI
ncbi:MAG: hypothetical protein NC132_00100 [Corallococcus sp.]|nr:hypothetical protein [Corallococcus sp.]MCM1359125.1 hypothetical protein [Corallococcus sp.]MCM1394515.1 hypothetical protein [Corallococcus sp.]